MRHLSRAFWEVVSFPFFFIGALALIVSIMSYLVGVFISDWLTPRQAGWLAEMFFFDVMDDEFAYDEGEY